MTTKLLTDVVARPPRPSRGPWSGGLTNGRRRSLDPARAGVGGPRDDGGRAPRGAHRAATAPPGHRRTPEEGTMAEVVLFHHVQGLTEGVRTIAESLRGAGNVVHTPDLFEGRTFATLDEGMAHVQELGFGTVLERGRAVADGYDAGVVYAGISLGVLPAQMLAQTRSGAKGAVLLEACVPVSEFGAAWPDAVPVQVHGMDGDPSFAGEGDLDAARELVDSTPDAELFVYPGDRHLFTDPSLPSYEPEAAALVTERVIRFLDGIR
ncbi:MAG: dienelactone hydrolase family protein [Cellulosimicrobium cellulans]